MSTEQREMTPEEKIADLYKLVNGLRETINDMESTIDYLRRDVGGKAHDSHGHAELHAAIRDLEYHSHHEYADSRHTHDRWDMR